MDKGEFTGHLRTVKSVVEHVLRTNKRSRGNDRLLIKEVEMICRNQVLRMPAHETITRCRRKFNADGRFLPEQKVLDQRRKRAGYMLDASRKGII